MEISDGRELTLLSVSGKSVLVHAEMHEFCWGKFD